MCTGVAMQVKDHQDPRLMPMTAGQMLADKEVKGFVARMLNSGAVSYGYRYRDKTTGKQRWLGLGLHGSNITAEQARDLAKKAAGEVANKKDPVGELEKTRAEANGRGWRTTTPSMSFGRLREGSRGGPPERRSGEGGFRKNHVPARDWG